MKSIILADFPISFSLAGSWSSRSLFHEHSSHEYLGLTQSIVSHLTHLFAWHIINERSPFSNWFVESIPWWCNSSLDISQIVTIDEGSWNIFTRLLRWKISHSMYKCRFNFVLQYPNFYFFSVTLTNKNRDFICQARLSIRRRSLNFRMNIS